MKPQRTGLAFRQNAAIGQRFNFCFCLKMLITLHCAVSVGHTSNTQKWFFCTLRHTQSFANVFDLTRKMKSWVENHNSRL